MAERGQFLGAARYLARCIGLAPGAFFESEARWQLAVSLDKLGKTKESQVELAKLMATRLNDAFVERARDKLNQQKPQVESPP